MEIDILIPCGVVTSKAVAWGGKAPELYHASQEAIRHAVQNSGHRQQLQAWFEGRIGLYLHVEFYLSRKRVSTTDLDSLIRSIPLWREHVGRERLANRYRKRKTLCSGELKRSNS